MLARESSGPRDYRRAVRDYVHAHGGARAASHAATSGAQATARLGGFLSTIATRGVSEAARAFGLAPLAGKSADEVFAALTDALTTNGATLEESAARRAVADTLAAIYEKYGVEEGGLERLAEMASDDVRTALTESIGLYIFYRWTQELGLAIEKGSVSPVAAVVLEREMRQYIRDTVKVDLSGRDVLQVDWSGPDGRAFTERIFLEAYSLLETSL